MRQSSAILLSLAATILMAACNNPGVDPRKDPKPADAMPKSAKRGVAFSFSQITDLPLLSPYISWDYNWGNTPSDEAALWFDANEMDYCPMCWNGNYNADKIRAFVAAHPKTRYLLAFNEPNFRDQANMTPSQAAAACSIRCLCPSVNGSQLQTTAPRTPSKRGIESMKDSTPSLRFSMKTSFLRMLSISGPHSSMTP